MSPGQYLGGTTVAGVGLSIIIMALVLLTGVLAFGLPVSPAGLALGLGVTTVGTLSLAACGFLLSTLIPNARAVGAVGLVILFVLAFFSDVFITGGPEWMGAVGSAFPLKHMQNALAAAWDPAGPTVPWVNLLVMCAWGIGTGVLAVRLFRWEPNGRL